MILILFPVLRLLFNSLFLFPRTTAHEDYGTSMRGQVQKTDIMKSPTEHSLSTKSSRNQLCCLLVQMGPVPPSPTQGTSGGD